MSSMLAALLIGFSCMGELINIDSTNWRQVIIDVSPTGDDSASGQGEIPLATLQRAIEIARSVQQDDPDCDILISVAPGTYTIEKPLRIEPPLHNIEFVGKGADLENAHATAPRQERVTISGGRPITGWQEGEANRWTVTLPQVAAGEWHFRQLWKDDARLSRARFPKNDALLHLETVEDGAKSFTLSETIPGGNLADQDAELVVIQNWSIARVLVTHTEGTKLTTKDPAGWIGHDACTAAVGKPAFLENAYAFLDEPGEWYLDRKTGVLTYQAAEDEDPNQHEFIAPVAEQWLVVEGTPESPVKAHFQNIDFAHAAWPLPDTGYQGIQAGHFGPSVQRPVDVLPGAVSLRWAKESLFLKCSFSHTGASGVVMGAGSRRTALVSCRLADIGGNGVMVGWRAGLFDKMGRVGDHSLDSDWPDPAMAPTENVVKECVVTRAGSELWGCVGIFDAFSRGTQILMNHVHDLPYTGISIGFRWNTTETSQRETMVARNHVHDVMRKLADGGCIYTLGYQPRTVLDGNLLHGVPRSAYAHGGAPNNGIFFDEGSKGFLVKDNIIYDTSGEPIRFNQTNAENLTFGTNYFGIAPGDPTFPSEIAERAGKLDIGE